VAKSKPAWRGHATVLAVAGVVALVAFAAMLATGAAGAAVWLHRQRIADLPAFLTVFALVGALCCVPVVRGSVSSRDTAIFFAAVAMVAVLPAIGAFGTNNPLLTQFIRHMGPLFAALAMLFAFLAFAGNKRHLAPIACAVVAVYAVAQLTVTVLYQPYRLPRPALEQTVVLEAPPHMRGLKVDPETAEFVRALLAESERVAGGMGGKPMLAMFDIPGVPYILDARPVGYPWHVPGTEPVICDRMRADAAMAKQTVLIALDREEVSRSLIECLGQAGIDISRFKERARIAIPYPAQGRQALRLLVP
jgi:hypothetical protein